MSLAPQFAPHPRRVVEDLLGLGLALPEAMKRSLVDMASRLARLEGQDLQPSNGCVIEACTLGGATVLVEFEVTDEWPSSEDDPGEPGSVAPVRVLVNGSMVPAGAVADEDSELSEHWVGQYKAMRKAEHDAYQEDLAEQRAQACGGVFA